MQHVNWLENKELNFTFTGVTAVFANVILMVPIRFHQRDNNGNYQRKLTPKENAPPMTTGRTCPRFVYFRVGLHMERESAFAPLGFPTALRCHASAQRRNFDGSSKWPMPTLLSVQPRSPQRRLPKQPR